MTIPVLRLGRAYPRYNRVAASAWAVSAHFSGEGMTFAGRMALRSSKVARTLDETQHPLCAAGIGFQHAEHLWRRCGRSLSQGESARACASSRRKDDQDA